MDIAYFISDLLGQQGELSVPNLGYFVQMRMSAYYNEQEKRFYPPHYAVQFDPQVIDDDDTLAAHITARKKISLASSKYFIEKFVGNLRSQAQSEEVPFGGIGTFQSNGTQLVFKAGSKQDDPALFGLNPVGLYGTTVSVPTPQPVQPSQPAYTPQPQQTTAAYVPPPPSPVFTTTPVAATETHVPQPPEPVYSTPPAYTPPPAPVEETQPYVQQRVEPTQYAYEDEKRGLGVWAIIGIIVIILGAGTAALYYVKPQIFAGLLKEKNPYTNSQPTAPAKHTDSVQSSSLPDTAVSGASTIPRDTVGQKAASSPEPAASTTANNAPVVENKTTTATNKVATETPKPAAITVNKPVETKPAAAPVTTPSKPIEQPVSTAPAATVPATADGVAKGLWVIRAGTYQSKSGSDERLDQLKGKGFAQARLEKTNVKRGGNYKVILGVYKTKEEARSKADDLMATGKITKAEIAVEQVQ